MHIATICNNMEVMEVLLAGGANINTKDNSCWIPSDHAVRRGYVEAVRILQAASLLYTRPSEISEQNAASAL